MTQNPQKTEVHEATEDASTSPATGAGSAPDVAGYRAHVPSTTTRPTGNAHAAEDAFPPGVKVVRDDSDAGGPIEIVTDPDRQPK